MTQKETIFLKEEQKKLDDVTNEVIDEIKAAYGTFYNSQKRIENLRLYEEDNFNIVKIYKKQLADGTRTFIDILNAEAELYRSSIDKIQKEFDYYTILINTILVYSLSIAMFSGDLMVGNIYIYLFLIIAVKYSKVSYQRIQK